MELHILEHNLKVASIEKEGIQVCTHGLIKLAFLAPKTRLVTSKTRTLPYMFHTRNYNVANTRTFVYLCYKGVVRVLMQVSEPISDYAFYTVTSFQACPRF